MKEKYIKMNNNKDYLSLGNLFNIIKKHSKVINSAMQVELFYSIFNVNNVNKTTINNFLIGYRPISFEYKKIYLDLKEKYKKDKLIFIDIILNILNILDEHIYIKKDNSIDLINNNDRLMLVCNDLIKLSKEDKNISKNFIKKLKKSNNYECIIEILFYCILDNKQPIYIQKINNNFNNEELQDYLKINLYEGISYITSLKELAKKNNMYANAELGSLEFSGIITGECNYENSYKYYMNAALKNHPKACWMVANLMLTKKVEYDFDIMWKFLNKAIELGNIAAINTLGNCYKLGINPENKIDINNALKYYKEASSYGYVYAYNNIGLIYEEQNDLDNAIKYFKLSADLFNSWALNKVGEYYRNKGDLVTAYDYYIKSIESPITERNYYGYYNLAKYYYLIGNKELGIKKDIEKANTYFDIAKKHINITN